MSISNNPKSRQAKIEGSFYPLQEKEICTVVNGEVRIYPDNLKEGYRQGYFNATFVLAIHIKIFKPKLPIKDAKGFCQEYGMPLSTFYEAVKRLQEAGEYPLTKQDSVEKTVRDRLQSQLGGLTEVVTAVGRIDVLTKTEVIEVKRVKDWKSALGQVLAYSSLYPNHGKRIHLFGKSKPSDEVTQVCSQMDVLVTFEEVCNA